MRAMHGQGIQSYSVEEFKNETGHEVILPSYLPTGGIYQYMLSDTSQSGRFVADLSIIPSPQTDSPVISLQEKERSPGEPIPRYGGEYETTVVGKTTIACETLGPDSGFPGNFNSPVPGSPSPKQSLLCLWDDQSLSYEAQFGSRSETVDQQLKDEAMKVITSMIERPYAP